MLRKTDINGKLVQFAWWALATIVFTLVVAIRIRLLGIPLERDEGEYAYAGQLICKAKKAHQHVLAFGDPCHRLDLHRCNAKIAAANHEPGTLNRASTAHTRRALPT